MEEEELSFSDCDFSRIEDWLRDLNQHGTMNLLFSEGKALFAYRDQNGYNGLCCTYRTAPFPAIELKDEDWKVDLAQQKRPLEKGFIVATRALTDELWHDLARGRLLVIRGGEAIYGDPRA
jgi:predicted glutamine amidotransferase